MNILELIILPAIIFLGIITSYQDIKSGKIKNKWIILSFAYVIISYIIYISFFGFLEPVKERYFLEVIVNSLIAAAIGYGLWHIGFWTAGDGKLFITYCAILPLSFYSLGFIKWFPSLVILLNLFAVSFIILMGFFIYKTRKEANKTYYEFIIEYFKPMNFFSSLVFVFVVYWGIKYFSFISGINSYLSIILFSIFLPLIFLQKIKSKTFFVIMIAISIIRLIFDKSIYSRDFLIEFLILVLVMNFIRSLFAIISKIGRDVFSNEVAINDLKPGMILSENIIKNTKLSETEIKKINKQDPDKLIKFNKEFYLLKPKSYFNFRSLIFEEGEGLTQEQINILKNFKIKKIRVSQTIAFAPIMFFGVILTIISRGNLIFFLRDMLSGLIN